MKNFSLTLIAAVLVSCTGKQKHEPQLINPLVEIQTGLVQGVINDTKTVVSFKGIPYAAPPVGELRWKEPQSPEPWEGIRDANEFCMSCMQTRDYSREPWTSEFMVQNDINEDCLFLNIWTPAKTANDKLPVLLYIHGGGFTEGSGAIEVYNGENLAQKGILVVTINYRLGILGFLAHPELTSESPNHSSGNYGFLDQIAALKWIKNNIEAFGGDPDCVTISGQSAGAMSVDQLIISPLGKGLFHRAITQSGSSYSWAVNPILGGITLKEAEELGVKYASSFGVSSIEDLRAMPADKIIAVNSDERVARLAGNIDGYFQMADKITVFAEGKQNDIPFMTGLNADETRYVGDKGNDFKALYPSEKEEDLAVNLKLAGQEQGRLNAWMWLEIRGETSKTNGYVYYFNRAIPWPEHPEYGAFHTAEVPYVFNNMDRIVNHTMTQKDSLIADEISSYWVNFVKTGDPNGQGMSEWAAFNKNKHEVMMLGEVFGMIPITDTEIKYDFLKKQLLK